MCCDWSVILILYHPSLNMISFPPRHSSLFIAVAQSTARSATKWTKNLVPLCLKSYPKIQLSPFLTNPILCPSILLILLCSIYIALLSFLPLFLSHLFIFLFSFRLVILIILFIISLSDPSFSVFFLLLYDVFLHIIFTDYFVDQIPFCSLVLLFYFIIRRFCFYLSSNYQSFCFLSSFLSLQFLSSLHGYTFSTWYGIFYCYQSTLYQILFLCVLHSFCFFHFTAFFYFIIFTYYSLIKSPLSFFSPAEQS